MTREQLKGIGIEDDTLINQIMELHGKKLSKLQREVDAGRLTQVELKDLKKQLEGTGYADATPDMIELQKELDEARLEIAEKTSLQSENSVLRETLENEKRKAQAAEVERDYTAALASHLKGVQFRSKLAEKAYIEGIKTSCDVVKDGEIVGANEYLNQQKELDPEAFGTYRAGGEPRQIGGNASNNSGKQLGEYMNDIIRQQREG